MILLAIGAVGGFVAGVAAALAAITILALARAHERAQYE